MLSTDVVLQLTNRSFAGPGWHRPLIETIQDLTAAQAAWQPPGGLHTTWQLTGHLTWVKQYLLQRLNGEQPTMPETEAENFPNGNPDDEAGWQALLAELRQNHEAVTACLAQCTSEELGQPLKGGKVPACVVAGIAAAHDSYHAGQVVVNRRLQGSWPPPGAPE